MLSIQKRNNDNLYQMADFFMLRTPTFPVEYYHDMFEHNKDNMDIKILEHATLNSIFREAILVSSTSLYFSLIYFDQTKLKSKDKVTTSLLNYFIRMSMRPTPFGICSNISFGMLSDKTKIENNQLQKRTRPDMEWLYSIVKKLESKRQFVYNLKVFSNPLLYMQGTKIKLSYLSEYGLNKKNTTRKINFAKTPILEFIKEYSKQPILFKELYETILNTYTSIPSEKILNYLFDLVEKEFLITSLRPSPLIGNSFGYVMSQIKYFFPNLEEDNLCKELLKIEKDIEVFNKIPIGKGEEQYLSLTKRMKNIIEVDKLLQVDLYNNRKATLNSTIKKQVEEVAEILYRISPDKREMNPLNDFHIEFIKQYGLECEVPLLDLLDEISGIGISDIYKVNNNKNSFFGNYENILSVWLSEAILSGKTELKISDKMIDMLEDKEKKLVNAPESLELYFTIAAESEEDIDKGNYRLISIPNTGSLGIGKSFGRFIDMLEDKDKKEIVKSVSEIESQNKEVTYVEVSCLPLNARAENVMITENLRKYELSISTSSSSGKTIIDIQDLVVGATSERIYLKSHKLNKEIIPTATHMMNNQKLMPELYQFLIDIGISRYSQWSPFNWGTLSKSPFLPRVTYKNTIISLASWRINRLLTVFSNVNQLDQFIEAIKKWRVIYNVPQFVNMIIFDKKITLNLILDEHINLVFKDFLKLSNSNNLSFTELGLSNEDYWIKGENNEHYMMEVVFSVLKNKKYKKDTNDIIRQKQYIPKVGRTKFIGNEWIYLKIYCPKENQEILLLSLYSFCINSMEIGLINSFYYIRYADPKPHIRLRIKGDFYDSNNSILFTLNTWTSNLGENGIIKEVSIHEYNPEIERYGGPKVISLAEAVFAKDSEVILKILEIKKKNLVTIEFLAIINILHILEQFQFTIDDQLEWLKGKLNPKLYSKEFRNLDRKFLSLTNQQKHWENLRSFDLGKKIYSIYSLRSESLNKYILALRTETSNPYNSLDDIIASIIHMSLNRLGFYNEQEKMIMTLAYRTLVFNKFNGKKGGGN